MTLNPGKFYYHKNAMDTYIEIDFPIGDLYPSGNPESERYFVYIYNLGFERSWFLDRMKLNIKNQDIVNWTEFDPKTEIDAVRKKLRGM